jgi:rhodanese-related sulfurtransferase
MALVVEYDNTAIKVVSMKTFSQFIAESVKDVDEIFPWDLEEKLEAGDKPLLLDIREPYEFVAMHIEGSINVPRGILETACEYDFEETVPELVQARDSDIVVICRSGNRSVLAAHTMKMMGYKNPTSLKTGLRGWNDAEQPLVNKDGKRVPVDDADDYFMPRVKPEQMAPKNK